MADANYAIDIAVRIRDHMAAGLAEVKGELAALRAATADNERSTRDEFEKTSRALHSVSDSYTALKTKGVDATGTLAREIHKLDDEAKKTARSLEENGIKMKGVSNEARNLANQIKSLNQERDKLEQKKRIGGLEKEELERIIDRLKTIKTERANINKLQERDTGLRDQVKEYDNLERAMTRASSKLDEITVKQTRLKSLFERDERANQIEREIVKVEKLADRYVALQRSQTASDQERINANKELSASTRDLELLWSASGKFGEADAKRNAQNVAANRERIAQEREIEAIRSKGFALSQRIGGTKDIESIVQMRREIEKLGESLDRLGGDRESIIDQWTGAEARTMAKRIDKEREASAKETAKQLAQVEKDLQKELESIKRDSAQRGKEDTDRAMREAEAEARRHSQAIEQQAEREKKIAQDRVDNERRFTAARREYDRAVKEGALAEIRDEQARASKRGVLTKPQKLYFEAEVTRTVEAAAKAKAEMEAAAGNLHMKIEVDGIAEAAAKIRAERALAGGAVGGGGRRGILGYAQEIGNAFNSASNNIATFDNLMRGLLTLGIAVFFSQLVVVVGAAAGALMALASSAIYAGGAIGGALVGGIAQALPVLGLLGAALYRWKSVMDAAQQSQLLDQQQSYKGATAKKKLADTADQVANAHKRQKDAQDRLVEARRQALKQLDDLILAEEKARLAAEGAVLSQEKSQDALRQAIASGRSGDIAQAQLDVRGADLTVRETGLAARRATTDRIRGVAAGVEGNPQVQAAREQIQAANRDLARAKRGADAAGESISAAEGKLNFLLGRMSGAERRMYEELKRLQDAFRNAAQIITEPLTEAATRGMVKLEKLFKDRGFLNAFTRLSQQMANQMDALFTHFSSPKALKTFEFFITEAGRNLKPLRIIIQSFGDVFLNVSRAAAPALRQIFDWLSQVTTEWAKWTGSIEGQTWLQTFFAEGVTNLKSWMDLLGSIGKLFLAIAGPGGGMALGLDLVNSMTGGIDKLTTSINNGGSGAQFFNRFFRVTREVLDDVWEVLKAIGHQFDITFDDQAHNSLDAFTKFLTDALIPAIGSAMRLIAFFSRVLNNDLIAGMARAGVFGLVMFGIFSKLYVLFKPLGIILKDIGVALTKIGGLGGKLKSLGSLGGLLGGGAAEAGAAAGGAGIFSRMFGRGRGGPGTDLGPGIRGVQRVWVVNFPPSLGGGGPVPVDPDGPGATPVGPGGRTGPRTAFGRGYQRAIGQGSSRYGAFARGARGQILSTGRSLTTSPVGRAVSGAAIGIGGNLLGSAIGGRTGSVVSGVATGAGLGMAFGPWGAAAGGAIGGVISLLHKGASEAQKFTKKIQGFATDIRSSIKKQDFRGYDEGIANAKKSIDELEARQKVAIEGWGGSGKKSPFWSEEDEKALADAKKALTEFEKSAPVVNLGKALKISGVKFDMNDIIDPVKNRNAIGQFLGNIERMNKYGVTSIKDLRSNLSFNVKEINKGFVVGSAGWRNAMVKNFNQGIASVKQGMHDGTISTKDGTAEIARLVQKNMKLARGHMDSLSQEARDALARNLHSATEAAIKEAGGIEKATGAALRKIRRMLAAEYEAYGIDPEQAREIARGRTGKKHNIYSESYGGTATGGWVGNQGERGEDSPRYRVGNNIVGRGEAVLNWAHQQYLRVAHGVNLNDVFRRVRGVHAGVVGPGGFAGGGFAEGGLHEGIRRAVEAILSRFPGLSVTSTTGGGHAANSYHYKGMAVDIGGSVELMRRAAQWIGSTMGSNLTEGIHAPNLSIKGGKRVPSSFWGATTWGNHFNHIHIAIAGALGKLAGLAGQLKSIKPPHITGGGSFGGVAQLGINSVTRAANRHLRDVVDSLGGGDTSDVGGTDFGPGSMNIAKTIVSVGRSMGAPVKALLAAIETGIVESGLRNLDYGDRDSLGVFQQRPSQGWGTPGQVRDVRHAAGEFFKRAIANAGNAGSAGQLAQSVQRSAFPGRYDAVRERAASILHQLGVKGFASGGYIPGQDGQPVPILAHAGEWVVNKIQQSKLAQLLGMGVGHLRGALGFTGGPTSYAGGGDVKGPALPEWLGGVVAERRRKEDEAHERRMANLKGKNNKDEREAENKRHKQVMADIEAETRKLKRRYESADSEERRLMARRAGTYLLPTILPRDIHGTRREIDRARQTMGRDSNLGTKGDNLSRFTGNFGKLTDDGGLLDTLRSSIERYTRRLSLAFGETIYKVKKLSGGGRQIQRIGSEAEQLNAEIGQLGATYVQLVGERGTIRKALNKVTRKLKQARDAMEANDKKIDRIDSQIADIREGGVEKNEKKRLARLQAQRTKTIGRRDDLQTNVERLSAQRINVQDRLDDARERVNQALADLYEKQVDQFTKQTDEGMKNLDSRQQTGIPGLSVSLDKMMSYAQNFGTPEQTQQLLGFKRDDLVKQFNYIKERQAEATKRGYTDYANQLGDQMGELWEQIRQTSADLIQNSIDAVNAQAENVSRAADRAGRRADIVALMDPVKAAQLREQVNRDRIGGLNAQIGGLQGILAAGGLSPKQMSDLTNQIADLQVAVEEATAQQKELAVATRQAMIEQINLRAQFGTGTGSSLLGILTKLASGSGVQNTDEQRKVLEQMAQFLSEQGSGLRDQFQQLTNISLRTDPLELVRQVEGVLNNWGTITQGMTVSQKNQLQELVNSILGNTDATLDNTQQIKDLSGSGVQGFSSAGWRLFRQAIFNGMGGLMPQYQIPQMQTGGFVTRSGLFQLHAGEFVVNPQGSNLPTKEGDVNVHIHEVKERADALEIGKRVMWEKSTTSR